MKIKILHKGDKVINVTKEFVAVQRKNGEVDLVCLNCDETGIRIDTEKSITIGYGNNTVEFTSENGVNITNF